VGQGGGGRVPHGFAVQQDVPAKDGAVGGDVAGFRGAGDMFDGDIETGGGEGVFQEDAVHVNIVEDGGGSNGGGQAAAAANTGQKRRTTKAERHVVNGEGEEEGEEDEAVVDRVCEIVQTWTAEHEGGKVIIYGGTIKRVRRIAEQLGCAAYWRGIGNPAEKARRIGEWMSSKGGPAGWIAATNALGLGLDDPNVGLVVHGGMPRRLVDLVQESGRGGRGGRKSESVVVIRRSWLTQQAEIESGQSQAGPRTNE
ncbi:ATP-dependent DNA helicase Q1, partial [Fusarium albosuccineum]